jgi:glycosyltransferase involved in cell wall biosynthesis
MVDNQQLKMTAVRKRVLYLSYDGLTDPLGQSQILPYLTGLSDLGHQITIVSFEKRERFSMSASAIKALCAGSRIEWIPLFYHKNPPVFSTLYDLFSLRQKTKELMSVRDFHLIHCRSYITPIVGMWLKKKFKCKLIFDMRGFWADERVEGGLWNRRNPVYERIYQFFKRKERHFITQADHVVVLTNEAKNVIETWGIKSNLTVIPCCVDLDLFNSQSISNEERSLLRKKLSITQQTFVLIYIGSVGTWYLFDEMQSYFARIKAVIPDSKFLVLTPDKEKVPSHPDYIVLTVSRSEVPRYIAISDASICFIKPSFSKKGSSATKMAEVLAMEIPVITNPGWGDVDFLNGKVHGLLVVQPDQPVEVSTLTLKAQRNELFTQMYSLQQGIQRYHTIYCQS